MHHRAEHGCVAERALPKGSVDVRRRIDDPAPAPVISRNSCARGSIGTQSWIPWAC